TVAFRGLSAEAERLFRGPIGQPGPTTGIGRMLAERRPIQITDVTDDIAYRQGDPLRVRTVQVLGARSAVWLPLLKADAVVGAVAERVSGQPAFGHRRRRGLRIRRGGGRVSSACYPEPRHRLRRAAARDPHPEGRGRGRPDGRHVGADADPRYRAGPDVSEPAERRGASRGLSCAPGGAAAP